MDQQTTTKPNGSGGLAPTGRGRDLSNYLHGFRRELTGGGWVKLIPRVNNLPFLRRREQLIGQYRAERGLALDAPLPTLDQGQITLRALVTTVLVGWGEFYDGDNEMPSDEETGVFLLSLPDVGLNGEIGEAMDAVDKLVSKDLEVAEGNSPPLSAGSSGTEST